MAKSKTSKNFNKSRYFENQSKLKTSEIPNNYRIFKAKLLSHILTCQNQSLKGQMDLEDFIHARAGKPGFEWHPAHPRFRLGGCCS